MTTYRLLNMSDTAACPDLFEAMGSRVDVVSRPADPRMLENIIPDFDIYFASLKVAVTRAILDRAQRLKIIVTPSTGTDHIDMAYAKSRGITILSLKEERAFLDQVTATAEMAWALLLAVARRLPWSFSAAQQGDWARDRFRGHQLSGKTLGILGYGRLGTLVAHYGQAFRMRVLACDILPVTLAPGVTRVDFDTLLRESDVLSIHIHLTDANRRLINAAALNRMKPDAFLINTSRGAIMDEAALLDALAQGRLGGAGVDIIDGEWDTNLVNHPMIAYARTHENLVISPHTGGVTFESQSMAYRFMAQKLKDHVERSR